MKRLPPLDQWRADEMLQPPRPKPVEKVWGLQGIASVLGVSIDTARRWANSPKIDVPITRPAGRYFAMRSELLEWLRRR